MWTGGIVWIYIHAAIFKQVDDAKRERCFIIICDPSQGHLELCTIWLVVRFLKKWLVWIYQEKQGWRWSKTQTDIDEHPGWLRSATSAAIGTTGCDRLRGSIRPGRSIRLRGSKRRETVRLFLGQQKLEDILQDTWRHHTLLLTFKGL